MSAVDVNLVVGDLKRSYQFYVALGCEFRAIRNEGSAEGLALTDEVVAWMGVGGPIPLTIHQLDFARWWNTTQPSIAPGSTVIDLIIDRQTGLAISDSVVDSGGEILQPWRDMPWGQAYLIFADPDGYQWGIKTDPAGSS